jgi:hypothetical protein
MAEALDEELTAAYNVTISGIKRTRDQMARLDGVIRSLRATQYQDGIPVTNLAQVGATGIAVALVDELEGRVQTQVQQDMLESMRFGKDLQAAALQAAVTPTGEARKHGNGPGRDDTGEMIDKIAFNVEVLKTAEVTYVTGWHGWKADARGTHIDFQERGTRRRGGLGRHTAKTVGILYRKPNDSPNPSARGVPAANSLGVSIVPVREALRALIARL